LGDVSALVDHFIEKYNKINSKNVRGVSSEVTKRLLSHGWPGNIRELENIIERGVALSNGSAVEVAHLPEDLRELSIRTFRKREGKIPSLEEQEISYIRWVLGEVGSNKTLAAQILGIDRVSLWRKLKKYGLE